MGTGPGWLRRKQRAVAPYLVASLVPAAHPIPTQPSSLRFANSRALKCVVDVDGVVCAAGDERFAIGCKLQRIDAALVVLKHPRNDKAVAHRAVQHHRRHRGRRERRAAAGAGEEG